MRVSFALLGVAASALSTLSALAAGVAESGVEVVAARPGGAATGESSSVGDDSGNSTASIANNRLSLQDLRLIERSDVGGLTALLLQSPLLANATSYRSGHCSAVAYAAQLGHADVVDALAAHDAFLEARCFDEQFTPLMLACLCSLQHEVNHNVCPTHLAQEGGDKGAEGRESEADSHVAVVEALLARGASPAAVDAQGRTALHFAALNGHEGILLVLLDQNPELSVALADQHGWTPLLYAVQRGDDRAVDALLRAGAPVDASDKIFATPTMHAAHLGAANVLKTLLTHGANPLLRDSAGQSISDYATNGAADKATMDVARASILDASKTEL